MISEWDDDREQFEYHEVGELTTHKARTPKTCGLCGQSIKPGQQYQKRSFVFEGDISTAYHHLPSECVFETGDAPF